MKDKTYWAVFDAKGKTVSINWLCHPQVYKTKKQATHWADKDIGQTVRKVRIVEVSK